MALGLQWVSSVPLCLPLWLSNDWFIPTMAWAYVITSKDLEAEREIQSFIKGFRFDLDVCQHYFDYGKRWWKLQLFSLKINILNKESTKNWLFLISFLLNHAYFYTKLPLKKGMIKNTIGNHKTHYQGLRVFKNWSYSSYSPLSYKDAYCLIWKSWYRSN